LRRFFIVLLSQNTQDFENPGVDVREAAEYRQDVVPVERKLVGRLSAPAKHRAMLLAKRPGDKMAE
jgi:hypothetical protein